MTRPTLQLLDSDESTVLFDFGDETGAANPSGVTCYVRNLDLGTLSPEITLFEPESPGARVVKRRDPPVEMLVSIKATAAGYDELASGLGQLAAWLADPPGPLKLVGDTDVRFIDLLGSTEASAIIRGGVTGLALSRADTLEALHLPLLRQPYLRGPEVTLANAVTVPNDPVDASGKLLSLTAVPGNVPMPARMTFSVPSGTGLLVPRKVTVALYRDLLADIPETHFAELDQTGGGWTITLGTNTTRATGVGGASGSDAARCSYGTASANRVTASRSTKIEALTGTFDLYLRGKSTATGTVFTHTLNLEGMGLAFTFPEVSYDSDVQGTVFSRMYFGRFTFLGPSVDREIIVHSARTSGSGSFDFDVLEFEPVDEQAHLIGLVGLHLAGGTLQTFPETGRAIIQNSSGRISLPPEVEGRVPLWIPPGDSIVRVNLDNAAPAGGHPENIIADDLTVTIKGSPRFRM